jgi:hypothetical protein
VEYGFAEEGYFEVVKKRGMDPGHENFQVFAYTSELKRGENGENDACWQRGILALSAMAESRGLEFKFERF